MNRREKEKELIKEELRIKEEYRYGTTGNQRGKESMKKQGLTKEQGSKYT